MRTDDKTAPHHPVTILPLDITLLVPDGHAVMPTAVDQGYRWPNVCNGEASCGVCWLVVDEGMEHASPIERDEQVRLEVSGKANDPKVRLACQMHVSGPMTVRKRGIRPPKEEDG